MTQAANRTNGPRANSIADLAQVKAPVNPETTSGLAGGRSLGAGGWGPGAGGRGLEAGGWGLEAGGRELGGRRPRRRRITSGDYFQPMAPPMRSYCT